MKKKKKEVKGRKINKEKAIPQKIRINFFDIIGLLLGLIVLVFSFITFGLKLTIVVAAFLLIVAGIWILLKKIKSKKKKRKIVSLLLIFVLLIGIATLLAFCGFMVYVKTQADPKFETAKLNTLEVSRIYDKDGNQFAKLGSENREKVTYEQLPEVLVDAIVATEDSRYFQHNGFDAPRFVKATIGQFTKGSSAGGASTVTMQVVKNSFTSKEAHGIQGIVRKFEDIYLAVFKLEKKYSKEEILEFYVNNHFLGGNIYGVQEASNAYFGKDVSELNLSEAAILAGMFKSPNAYRPTTNPEAAAGRRKTVLYLMRKHGYITKEEEEIANSIPVESITSEASQHQANPYQGYIDTVVDELKDKYGVNPYTTPLLVYTNLDRGRQDGVNRVLSGETYEWKDDKVQSGIAVIESESGKILAIGNGRNINSRNGNNVDQFNYATEIRRQPGSTAKPLFDYGPGIEYNNWSTYQLFDDAPYSYSNGRSIKNWDGGYYGTLTLRRALALSRNIPALKAFQQVENAKIIEFVTNLGITPEIEDGRIHEAHAIGAFTGVSPVQMAGAYAAFSNGGYYTEPYTVTKVVWRQTKETKEYKDSKDYVKKRQVMSDATAFMIASVLQDVSLTGGTPYNVACKTGTTNYDDNTMYNYNMPDDAVRDSWVVGFSTKTTIGMWYGYDSLTKEEIAQGYILHNIPATMAKDRLFNAIVASGAMEGDRSPFEQPQSVVKVGVAAGSNPAKLAYNGNNAIYEYFKKGYEPTEYDWSSYKLPAPGNFNASVGNGKVVLSWGGVNPGEAGKPEYGKFGYNVYKDGVLLDWTDKTSYTYTGNVYGTYKVIATYKSYSGIQSSEAVLTVEEEKPKPKPDPEEPETPPSEPSEPTTQPNP